MRNNSNFKKYYYRHWCTKCNEWTIFEEKGGFREDKVITCKTCGLEHQKVKLSEIPEEKLKEQRDRWKLQQRRDTNDIYLKFVTGGFNRNPLMDMLTETPTEFEERIVEADAGQKSIDEAKREREAKERQKKYEERQKKLEWKRQYKGLGRNDKCICGSGKKYKKCCLVKVEKIR